jgi:hypothetical protein
MSIKRLFCNKLQFNYQKYTRGWAVGWAVLTLFGRNEWRATMLRQARAACSLTRSPTSKPAPYKAIPRCSFIVRRGTRCLAQTNKQFNIRQYFDTLFATTFENRPVMEMLVERAEHMHAPVQCCFQYRIVLLIVGNQPSANLGINQLREILKSLCVLLDVERRQRPEVAASGDSSTLALFRAIRTVTEPTRALPIPGS